MNESEHPKTLYNFANVSDAQRRVWTEDMLLRNRVYFRHRDELNDPSELRPAIVVQGTDRELLAYVRKIRSSDPRDLSPAKRLLEERRLFWTLRKRPNMPQEQLHELLDGVGVFCLSDSCTNQAMWAHYANGHRGIAIEFDPEIGFFSVAQRVVYSNEPAVINRLKDDFTLMLQKAILWKHTDWSYEQEWRVIARFRDEGRQELFIAQHGPSPSAAEFMRSQHGPGHYDIPPETVRSVVVGVRTPAADLAWLDSVLARRGIKVPIRRARLVDGQIVVDGQVPPL